MQLPDTKEKTPSKPLPPAPATLTATQASTLGAPVVAPVVPTEAERKDFADNAAKTPSPLNATQAGLMALSGGDTHVVPTEAERNAEIKGDVSAPEMVPPAAIQKMQAVNAPGPSTKEMIANIMARSGKPSVETSEGGFNFADLLKGAGGKIGDFLQRWGMGLQGAPEGKTQGDIQRAQAFELEKQRSEAQVMAQQQALSNTYQIQRMNLQNQMNLAALPIEKKAELQNRMAELDAEYQQKAKMLPLEYAQALKLKSLNPAADPGLDFVGGR